jgi:lipopolysaccharide transport system permease protein
MNNESNWDIEIRPKVKTFDLKLKQLWVYRDLLWLIVRRDFVSYYKQTILGPFWLFFQPLFIILTYTYLFGFVARISTGTIPMPLFYLSGLIAWIFFSETLMKTAGVFRDNSSIFSKVYFPRLIMPLSIVVTCFLRLLVQLVFFLLLLFFYKYKGADIKLGLNLLLLPLIILHLSILAIGLGLLLSSLTTKYRDFSLMLSYSITFVMYSSPIVYPLSALSEKIQFIIMLNPLTSIIESFRFVFFSESNLTMSNIVYSLSISIVVFISGLVVFNKVEKNFIDTI